MDTLSLFDCTSAGLDTSVERVDGRHVKVLHVAVGPDGDAPGCAAGQGSVAADVARRTQGLKLVEKQLNGTTRSFFFVAFFVAFSCNNCLRFFFIPKLFL